MVQTLATQKEFKDAIGNAPKDKLVVIDFFATWCGPCKMIAPKIEAMAKGEFSDVLFYKVDVDENEDTAADEEISAMPTFLFFKNGKQIMDDNNESVQIMGANENALKSAIEKYRK